MVEDGGAPTGDGDQDGPGEPLEGGAGAGADGPSDTTTGGEDVEGPTDREVVAAAAEAAEDVVFSRYRRSDVRDVDVAVTYEDGLLEVDVYLNVPDADEEERVDEEAGQVADDAAKAAIAAVDRLFEENGD